MSLPTAQLGQLPQMNLPYSRQYYQKEPNIWQKALASFLVNAAGSVATKGADNAMSHDYAQEFDKTPASGLSRLLGPTVSANDAQQMRQQQFVGGENTADRQARAGLADAEMANQGLRQDKQIQAGLDERDLADMNAGVRQDRALTAESQRTDKDIEGRRILQQLEETAYNKRPDVQGRAAVDAATARKYGVEADFQKSIMDTLAKSGKGGAQPQTSTGTPISSAIMNFAQGGGSGSTPVGVDDRITGLLNSGQTSDQIVNTLSPSLTPRQQAVQNSAAALGVQDQQHQDAMDAIVTDIKRRLGMSMDTGGSINYPTGTRIQ